MGRATRVIGAGVLIWMCASCATTSSEGRTEVTGEDQAASESESSSADGPFDYPSTRRQEIAETIHGQKVRDPYRWLEPNDGDEVQAWMDRQHAFTREYLDGLESREALASRYEELFYITSTSTPIRRDDRIFYSRQVPTNEKEIYYWRPLDGEGEETKLLDPNEMGGETNIAVGAFSPSPEGRRVAYTLKENNADAATLYVRNVATGEDREVDVIEGAKWANPSWTSGGEGFYYAKFPTDPSIPEPKRPGRADVRYHELGTDPAEDEVVRGPTGDPRTFQGAEVSRDGRWLVATVSHGWDRSDVYYRDREADEEAWRTLVEGRDHVYGVTAWRDDFYIRTDEGASNFRLYRVDAEAPSRDNWTEIVAEDEEAVLKRVQIVGGHLVISYLRDAHSQLKIYRPDGTFVREVELPGTGTTYGISGEPDRDEAFFTYQSFTTPQRVYRTSISSGGTELWSRDEIPVETSDINVEQVRYESKDGTEVSMFIVHKGRLERDGTTPFLLYGYGGFDVSLTPRFREGVIPWLEAGGGFAVPNLRGGGEYGDDWHKAGMLENKQNVFDDFIAAAEYLIEDGYTSSDRLGIEGRSNGGLLVSAVTTQRPELFRAVVCGVPLTDMVRYHEFGPANVWVHEYGDPGKAEQFEFLYEYSPYHNVEQGVAYPAFLTLSSARDDRVHPMHARKFAAALQWATSSDHPVLFRVEREAGHSGAARVRNRVEKETDRFAFLMYELGPSNHR